MGDLTEQHGHKLGPAREAFVRVIGLMLFHEFRELVTRKLFKELTEETSGLYHGIALSSGCEIRCLDANNSLTPAKGIVKL